MSWTRQGTSRRRRNVAVIVSTIALCAFVVGVSLLFRQPVTAAVCGDANPPPPDTGSGGPPTCPQNPTGTGGYFVANINGNVYGIGNAFPFPGFGTLHHAADGTDQDPGALGADISTTGDGAGFYLLDAGGNVYGRGDAPAFNGFGTLSTKGSAGDVAAGMSVTHEPGGGTSGMLIMDVASRVFGFGTQDGHGSAPWTGFGTIFQREQLQDAGHPNAPVAAGLALVPSDDGYYGVDSNGRIFGFGNAFAGPVEPSTYNFHGRAAGIMITADHHDLLVLNNAGQIYGFGGLNPTSPAPSGPYYGNASGRFPGSFVGIAGAPSPPQCGTTSSSSTSSSSTSKSTSTGTSSTCSTTSQSSNPSTSSGTSTSSGSSASTSSGSSASTSSGSSASTSSGASTSSSSSTANTLTCLGGPPLCLPGSSSTSSASTSSGATTSSSSSSSGASTCIIGPLCLP